MSLSTVAFSNLFWNFIMSSFLLNLIALTLTPACIDMLLAFLRLVRPSPSLKTCIYMSYFSQNRHNVRSSAGSMTFMCLLMRQFPVYKNTYVNLTVCRFWSSRSFIKFADGSLMGYLALLSSGCLFHHFWDFLYEFLDKCLAQYLGTSTKTRGLSHCLI